MLIYLYNINFNYNSSIINGEQGVRQQKCAKITINLFLLLPL